MTIDGWCNHRCVYLCVCVSVCVSKKQTENAFPLRACEHTCVAACFFHEKAPDFQSVPGSLLACWCQFQSLSGISGHSPASPLLALLRGHSSRGEIRSPRGLQHLNLSGGRSGGWLAGWREEGGGDYRLLSNALLRGQNQRRYLREPQEVEEKKRELATEKKDLCQGLWPPTEYDVRV